MCVSGADYGWPAREGPCAQTGSSTSCGAPTPAGMTDPVFAYDRSAGCGSITGGAFVPDGVWPASYDPGYVFAITGPWGRGGRDDRKGREG